MSVWFLPGSTTSCLINLVFGRWVVSANTFITDGVHPDDNFIIADLNLMNGDAEAFKVCFDIILCRFSWFKFVPCTVRQKEQR